MKNYSIFATLALLCVSSQAGAAVTHFSCTTEKELQGNNVSISFSLKGVRNGAPSFFGAIEVVPPTDALRALETGDNNDVSQTDKGIQIEADEIGMMHTTLVLYSNHGYHTGYVATSGESNEKLYSPISCSVR